MDQGETWSLTGCFLFFLDVPMIPMFVFLCFCFIMILGGFLPVYLWFFRWCFPMFPMSLVGFPVDCTGFLWFSCGFQGQQKASQSHLKASRGQTTVSLRLFWMFGNNLFACVLFGISFVF